MRSVDEEAVVRITIVLDGQWRPAVEITPSSPAEPALEGGAAPAWLSRGTVNPTPDAGTLHEGGAPTDAGRAPELEGSEG